MTAIARVAARFALPFLTIGALMWSWHFVAHKVAERLVELTSTHASALVR